MKNLQVVISEQLIIGLTATSVHTCATNNLLPKQEIQINPCKKTPNNWWKIISFQNKKSKLILARKHQTTDGKHETSWNACTKHINQTANNQFRKLEKVFKTNMRHNFSGKFCPRKGIEQQIKNAWSLSRPILTSANTDTLICLQCAPFFLALLVVWRKTNLIFWHGLEEYFCKIKDYVSG